VGRAAALAVAAALALPSVAAASVTKREFIRNGDALCRQTALALKPVSARAQAAKSLPQEQQWAAVASIWASQIRIQEQFRSRFKQLGVPAGDVQARSFGGGLDRGLVLARAVQQAFARRNESQVGLALHRYLEFTLAFNQRVHAYGFRVCGT
jgi:hypothetical protein